MLMPMLLIAATLFSALMPYATDAVMPRTRRDATPRVLPALTLDAAILRVTRCCRYAFDATQAPPLRYAMPPCHAALCYAY